MKTSSSVHDEKKRAERGRPRLNHDEAATAPAAGKDAPKRRLNVEHLHVDTGVAIEETADFWVIPDCTLTKDGVMNGGRKLTAELALTWQLFEGIPFTHDHPGNDEFGVVIDRRRLAGFVDNVRFDDPTGRVVADVYVNKASVPGLAIQDDVLVRSQQLIAAVKTGERAELSIGFWSTDEYVFPAQTWTDPVTGAVVEYDRIQRDIIPDHVASVPLGACGPECALGSAQGRAPPPDPADPDGDAKGSAQDSESGKMPETPKPNGDCSNAEQVARRLDEMKQQLDAERSARAAADARLEAIEKKNATADATRVKAKVDELAKLTKKTADELNTLPEAALDLLLERERGFRGRVDGARVGEDANSEAARASASKDGVTVHARGATVTNWADALGVEAPKNPRKAMGTFFPNGRPTELQGGQ